MAVELREFTYRSLAISIKLPYEELFDHIKKEKINGWCLFSIQVVIGTPFTYLVTMYKE